MPLVRVLGGSGDLLCLGSFMGGVGVMKIWGDMKTPALRYGEQAE